MTVKELEDGPVYQAAMKALREARNVSDVAEILGDVTTTHAVVLAGFPRDTRESVVRGMLRAAEGMGGEGGSPDMTMGVAHRGQGER